MSSRLYGTWYKGYLCPKCCKESVHHVGMVARGYAKCYHCPWEGHSRELPPKFWLLQLLWWVFRVGGAPDHAPELL